MEGARSGPARGVGRLNRPEPLAADIVGRPAAVLLDMDGTLVDSDAAVERAWTGWAA